MASSMSKGPLFAATRPANLASRLLQSQCRNLSQSSPKLKNHPAETTDRFNIKPNMGPSSRTKQQNISRRDMPQDLGLLPGTFIRPLLRDMPSIFQQPRERLRMEWLWLKNGVQNFVGLVAYCKWLIKGQPLGLRERRQTARELYQKMYTAFAAGDSSTLSSVCCTGLSQSLTSRIAARPRDEKVTWSLDKYKRSPSTFLTGIRVMSDRATQIPDLPDSGVRQVVLRITSRQSSGKVKVLPAKGGFKAKGSAEPTLVPGPVKQQDCTEYIVLQKLRWTGQDEAWRIWGHATPTTVDDLSSPFFASGLSLAERVEAMKQSMEGGR